LITLVAVGMSATVATAQNPHFVGDQQCLRTFERNTCQVCCSGKIAGVGETPFSVAVDIEGGCITLSGSNEPPGHLQTTTGPIEPSGGNIVYQNVCVTLKCPGELDLFLDTTASISLLEVEGGEPIPVGDVTITGPLCPP
jgi:hypothetical protein